VERGELELELVRLAVRGGRVLLLLLEAGLVLVARALGLVRTLTLSLGFELRAVKLLARGRGFVARGREVCTKGVERGGGDDGVGLELRLQGVQGRTGSVAVFLGSGEGGGGFGEVGAEGGEASRGGARG
jgi:hypothetical protein